VAEGDDRLGFLSRRIGRVRFGQCVEHGRRFRLRDGSRDGCGFRRSFFQNQEMEPLPWLKVRNASSSLRVLECFADPAHFSRAH
jgi:hypothetical protein